MIVFEGGGWEVAHSITAGTLSWQEVRTVTPETDVTSFKKHEVSNALDGTEDAVVFEESAGTDSNNGVC